MQSFAYETRVLAVDAEEGMSECEIPGLANCQTLYCGNMAGGLWVQATQASVRLICGRTLQVVSEYPSQDKVMLAAGNQCQVLLALLRGVVVLLQLDLDARAGGGVSPAARPGHRVSVASPRARPL